MAWRVCGKIEKQKGEACYQRKKKLADNLERLNSGHAQPMKCLAIGILPNRAFRLGKKDPLPTLKSGQTSNFRGPGERLTILDVGPLNGGV